MPRIGFCCDACPGQYGALILNPRPFDIDQANRADHPAANGGQHRRIGHRIAVAFALQLCLILINRARDINREHKRDIDRFGSPRPGIRSENRAAGGGQKPTTMHVAPLSLSAMMLPKPGANYKFFRTTSATRAASSSLI